jgi:hypothetical protein
MTEVANIWHRRLRLKAGDWVVVRPAEEILQTLDEHGMLEGLPFQAEMIAYCGQRLRVAKVAHKTCDNIHKTGGRRMTNAVHLDGARCDGGGHGSCQADCVFFWKEAWLRRDGDPRPVIDRASTRPQVNLSILQESAYAPGSMGSGDPTYVCQTTALFDATSQLHWWDLRQYLRDVTSGNHGAWRMIKLLLFACYRKLVGLGIGYSLLVRLFNTLQRIRGGKPFPQGSGTIPDGKPTPVQVLNLKPGEWVEVKPIEQILETITRSGFNRGMRYDMEMSKYSGERHRVQMRVERLINEQTGKMMQMKTACIQLENVYCRAECTERRIGCPRASNTYWREIWLRRVDGP